MVGLGRLQGILGVQQNVFQLRAAEDHHDGIGLHGRAGTDQDALHPSIGGGGDEHGVFGNQRAQAAHLAQHRTALHRVRPQRRHLDARRGGLQLREPDSDADTRHRQQRRS